MSQFKNTKNGTIFGIPGEFTVGSGGNKLRAKYILTKMRPGDDGSWESELASRMVPWREVFQMKDLSFNELLQRDLDDSRVATNLIPYLLGKGGHDARFFPPIVAIIVPRNATKTGIDDFYPALDDNDKDSELFGDLFDISPVEIDGKPLAGAPLAQIKYNTSKCAFVIADGQHRAMALLAIHRQLNKGWSDNPFAYYYEHIQVTPEMVASIELPVSIVYFPDLTADNEIVKGRKLDLRSVCREIFLVVNRNAKAVSETRQLLLDDEDFAAIMMRQTLQSLKQRQSPQPSQIKIYSVAYGDSDDDEGGQVAAGGFQVATAVAIHRLHGLMSFASTLPLKWTGVSDNRLSSTRYTGRAKEILLGIKGFTSNAISQKAAKSLPSDQVDIIVQNLGRLNDIIIFQLFDKFRPFIVHSEQMEALYTVLSSTIIKSDPIQNHCHNLIFDGSGTINVFEAHLQRLHDMKAEDELDENGKIQLEHYEAVAAALRTREREFKRSRAAKLANIDEAQFYSNSSLSEDHKKLDEWAQRIYQTISTQAFQIGFVMAILTTIFRFEDDQLSYDDRFGLTTFVSELFITALNAVFSPDDEVVHRSLAGLAILPRASAFDSTKLGLRGLLAARVPELNEKQWVFFRYAVFELVFSQHAANSVNEFVNSSSSPWAAKFKEMLPSIVENVTKMRKEQIDKLVEHDLKNADFQRDFAMQVAVAKVTKEADEVEALEEQLKTTRRETAIKKAEDHIKQSIGPIVADGDVVKRIIEPLVRSGQKAKTRR